MCTYTLCKNNPSRHPFHLGTGTTIQGHYFQTFFVVGENFHLIFLHGGEPIATVLFSHIFYYLAVVLIDDKNILP